MEWSYKMDHPRRGKAIIINNEKFTDLPALPGSDRDLEYITRGLNRNQFDVEPYPNYIKSDIIKTARLVADEDHRDADCMVFCINSHGSEGGICGTDYKVAGDAIDTQDIVDLFIGDNCPSLVGKPKIFIINACQGKKNDVGVVNTMSTHMPSPYYGPTIQNQPQRIPTSADILIFTSSYPGYVSYQHPKEGSYFMKRLGDHLYDHGRVKPLRQIFDMVKDDVASHGVDKKDHQQMPHVKETLRKQIYFGQNWKSRNDFDDRPQSGMAEMMKEDNGNKKRKAEMTHRTRQRVVDSRRPHDMAMTSEDQTTDIQLPVLPLSSEGDLTTLETYLKKSNEKVNEILLEKLTSVRCIKNCTDNVLNALMTPELASNYTWKGKKNQKAFKDLRLVELVQKAVREEYPEATSSDIKHRIIPWLTDAHTKTTAKLLNT